MKKSRFFRRQLFTTITIFFVMIIFYSYALNKKMESNIFNFIKILETKNIEVKDIFYNYDKETNYTYMNSILNVNYDYFMKSEIFSGDEISKNNFKENTFFDFLKVYSIIHDLNIENKKIILKEIKFEKNFLFFKKEKKYKVFYVVDEKIKNGNIEIYLFTWVPGNMKLENVETKKTF